MPKGARKMDKAPSSQLSLFDMVRERQFERIKQHQEGSLAAGPRLRAALSSTLKACPYDRYEVAGRMSRLLGRTITKDQLDAWTAESKEGHRIPAEYLPAFCQAAGSVEPLRLLADMSDCFLLESEDALKAELGRIAMEKRELAKQEKAVRELLEQMLRGGGGQ